MDFGTTRIVVAAVDRGNYPVVSFEDAEGVSREWFAPLVAVRGRECVFGWQAWQAQFEPEWTVLRSLKRVLEGAGPASSIEIAGQAFPIMHLLRGMTESLRDALSTCSSLPGIQMGQRYQVMLGVPANANSNQRFLTVEAFRQGGFEVLGLLNEPSAASIEYGHRNRESRRVESLLVYDLGGGTFDASLVTISERLHTVVATEGAGDLGGDDFDVALAMQALSQHGVDGAELTESELHRLHEECRARKEALNPNTRRVVVDLGVVREGWPQVAVPAGEYYERCRPLVERSIEITEQLLREHTEADVDALYITGGGSELPAVSRILKETFGRRARRSAYMRSATAIGLAIQADHESGYTLREIFHRHFGVWRESEDGRRVIFDPLFPKGSPVPAAGEPAVCIRRRYVPAHNIGHFRYLECTHTTDDNQPDGDITMWDDIRFPFAPDLAGIENLDGIPVERTPEFESQTVEESYSVDATGLVEVRIGNLVSHYSRTYRLGRWSARPDTLSPSRRRRTRAEPSGGATPGQ
ncbi:MAG TPA: Hsp70 family protein [Bryobacteraceae bacterium]|nr:Hsp70 family protein [Bryobacteraceae bacterium]